MASLRLFVPRALCAAFVPSFVLAPGLLAQAPGNPPAVQQPAAAKDPAAKPAAPSAAQDPQGATPAPQQRPDQPAADEPIVVTASRRAQDPFEAPRAIDVVSSQDIQQYQFRSTPQALRYLPSAMIQETSPGQGSPFLRGFTGYNNLLLIDGIRLNNSTFRSGPNQYWATVDPLSLDRIEVLRGPASTQWGSDAIGGTVQAITKGPTLYGKDGVRYGGAVYGRYATAEDSPMTRGEAQATWTREGGLRSGALVGGDARSIGDIEGGKDTGIQPNTSHKETAFDVKMEHELSAHSKLVFLHQEMSQNNVPRTHATVFGESWRGTTVGTDLQRDLDQDRRLSYVQLHQTDLGGAVSAARWSVSWQTQNENQDRVTGAGQARSEAFEVGTFGAFAQLESDLGAAGTLTYGVDYYRDNVNSWSRGGGSNVFQGSVGNDAKYDLFGAFVQDELELGGGLSAQAGVRYTYAAADADSVRSPTSNTAGIAVKDDWDEVTANVHLRQELTERWNVYGGASQGFRAPSLSDLTSFTVARSGEQEIASPGLDAEHYVGYELGTKARTGRLQTQLAWYWTDIKDQIVRTPTGTVSAGGLPQIAKSNAGDGYIQGTEVQVAYEVVERTTAFVVNSWQYGRVDGFDNNRNAITDYPSRLMPMTTIVGLKWDNAAGDFHCGTDVIRAEDADKLSQGDQADTQRIPPGGTPSYTLWNLRCGFRLDERASLELACENVTDVDYRVHGSGSNGLGRNFVVGMSVTF